MVSKRNPFYVLGLNRDVLKRLSDRDIYSLVTSQYRVLQMIHHPDRGGTDEMSAELTEAYDLLNFEKDRETFGIFKEEFLRKPRVAYTKRISELEKELDDVRSDVSSVQERFCQYFNGFLGIGEGKSVFSLGPAKFNMHDTSKSINFPIKLSSIKYGETFFYEMIVRKNGQIEKNSGKYNIEEKDDGKERVVRTGSKTEKFPDKRLVGSIDKDTIAKEGGVKKILRKVQSIWTFNDEWGAQNMMTHAGPGATLGDYNISSSAKSHIPRQLQDFTGRIGTGEFSNLVPLLVPTIATDSLVFAINRDEDDIYFTLEGRVAHRPEPKKKVVGKK